MNLNMGELQIAIKFEGADADITDIAAFFQATKQLNFSEIAALMSKVTKVTVLKIETTTKTENIVVPPQTVVATTPESTVPFTYPETTEIKLYESP